MKIIEHLGILDLLKEKFNYTMNPNSFESMVDMISEFPISRQKILDRNRDLKRLQDDLYLFQNYSYNKIYFNEMFRYLNVAIDKIDMSLNLFRTKEKIDLVKHKVELTLSMFKKIYQTLVKLDKYNYSDHFNNQIALICNFIERIELESKYEISKERRLNYWEIAKINNILFEKNREGKITTFFNSIFFFEAYLSLSLGIQENSFCFAEISENDISIQGFFHPLLKKPVSNTYRTTSNITILTGANMSGKSTFLKSISICIYLSNIGMAIPANEAKIPLFECIFISINKVDNIKSGYSHFMSELVNLKEVFIALKEKKKCFCIFDEIFNGTNVNEGKFLIFETIKGFCKYKDSFFYISTHNIDLKDNSINKIESILAYTDTYHLECIITDGKPIYTYKLKPGSSDINVASLLFDIVGIRALL